MARRIDAALIEPTGRTWRHNRGPGFRNPFGRIYREFNIIGYDCSERRVVAKGNITGLASWRIRRGNSMPAGEFSS